MNKDTPPHSFNLSQDDLFQMNRVLRHRLRNHSAGMKMTLSAIEKELQAHASPMAERCLLMKKELESLELMTERMDLVFADLPEQSESPLFQLIFQIQNNFKKKFPFIELRMDGPQLSLQISGGNFVQIILEEMLANAAESLSEDSDEIFMNWETQADGQLCFVVSNECEDPCLDIPYQDPRPFYTSKGRHDGLGLAICSRLSSELGGNFTILNESNKVTSKICIQPKEGK